ncbi:MAG: hypothetical protein GX555_15020 [Actinomycetales bacterium]|nr:hypothetical protein [Actinomycetales bacterium]
MTTDAIVILAVGVLAALLPLSGTYRSYLRRTLAAKAEATVPAEQEAALERRVTLGARAMGVGILVAGLLTLGLSQVWEHADEVAGGFFQLSVMFVAGAAGLAVAAIWWPGTTAEGPRTARATSPTVEDYLPPLVLVLGRIFVALGLLALAATLLLTRSEWFDAGTIWRSPVPLLAAALPVLVVLSWLAVRRILDAPQPARDETELYWQDAIRAQTLSSLVVVTPCVGLFALVVCGSVLDDAASTAATAAGQVGPAWSLAVLIAGYLLPFALVVAALVVAAGSSRRSEMRHFRERLWGGQPPRSRAEEAHA